MVSQKIIIIFSNFKYLTVTEHIFLFFLKIFFYRNEDPRINELENDLNTRREQNISNITHSTQHHLQKKGLTLSSLRYNNTQGKHVVIEKEDEDDSNDNENLNVNKTVRAQSVQQGVQQGVPSKMKELKDTRLHHRPSNKYDNRNANNGRNANNERNERNVRNVRNEQKEQNEHKENKIEIEEDEDEEDNDDDDDDDDDDDAYGMVGVTTFVVAPGTNSAALVQRIVLPHKRLRGAWRSVALREPCLIWFRCS